MRRTLLTLGLLQLCVGPGMARAQTPEWSMDVDHVIGSFDDEQTAFQYITHALLGPTGELFVVDADAPRIVVFDSTGAFLRSFGKEGAGPAELRLMAAAGFSADTLWVLDIRQSKIVRFSPTGDFARSERMENPNGPVLILSVSDRHMVGIGARSFVDDSARVIAVEGEAVRVLTSIRQPSARLTIEIGDVRSSGSHEFHDGGIVVASPDGNVLYVIERPFAQTASGSEFRISRFNGRGDRLWTRSYQYQPVNVSEYLVQSIVDDKTWRITQIPVMRSRVEEVRRAVTDALPVPQFAPPVWSAVAANDGSLWLERAREPEGSRWLVLDRDGDVIGRAGLQPGVKLSSVDGNKGCGIDLAGAEYPRVICYRIHR